jgi:dihydrodipicolinate synthase/N-acetylneuraminate lyase
MAAMANAANAGDMAGAAAIHHELCSLHQIPFAGSNPIPVKIRWH